MKKLLLLVIAFLPVFGFGQALSGNYVIGTSQTAPFNTLANAITKINSVGVSGPVTFLINNNQAITSPIVINQFAGSSATNTLTIKPNVGQSISITATNSTGSSVVPAVFKLDGADNIIFDGVNSGSSLNVINNENISYSVRSVFWLTNVTNNITIKNLKITQGSYNGDFAFSMGIFSGANNTIGNAGSFSTSKLVVSNNVFEGVKQGLYVNNSDGTTLSDVQVNGNKFGEAVGSGKVQHGIYLNGVSNFNVYENEIKDVNVVFTGGNQFSGIFIKGNNGVVNRNNLFNIVRQSGHFIAGLWLNSNVASNTNVNVLVSNNFIANVKAAGGNNDQNASGYGLYMESGKGYKIYHNTINLLEGQTTGITSTVLINSATGLDIRNNIFVNNADAASNKNAVRRFVIAVLNNTPTSTLFSNLNHNDYYVTAGAKGFIFGNGTLTTGTVDPAGHYTLAEWQAYRVANNIDLQSENVKPVFISDQTNLRLVPNSIVNVQKLGGVTGLNILVDFDAEARYIPRPTMGADEISETHCTQVVTWNGTSWNPAQPAGWIGDENVKIVIAGPYPMGDANLLKSCQLEIGAGAVLTIGNGSTYIVEDKLTLKDGSKMIVQDNGSFVQVREPDVNDIHPGAVFQVHRKSATMYRYDFTYWSSPVEGFRLKDVSPLTLFDKFYSWNAQIGTWTTLPQPANSTTLMETGVGYIVRAPQNYSTNPTIRDKWESIFKGKPNNGAKHVTVANGADNKWNLIGNPYPSAIDIDAFMTVNANVVEGAVYLWTHNSAIVPTQTGGQIYTYSASDYVTVNAAGLVVAGPQNNALGANNGDDFKIASGQSFFIKGKVSNANGNQVVFNNSMRVKQAGQNDQFLRPSPAEPNQNWETTGKHRVWLNLTGANDAFNQALVGYIENATNGLDSRYDADVFSGGAVSLYSLLDTNKLTIQGRALPFNNQDEVPMGYKTTLTGTLKIAIDHFDGLFQGQDIYLEDKVLNIVHNLKEADYTFTTVPGTFNERFVLRYVPAAELGIDNPTVDANSMIVFRNGSQIDIKSKDQSIEHVTVYDLLGKVIFDKDKINAQSFSTTQLNASNQVVIVKIITDTQAEVVKKVIMN